MTAQTPATAEMESDPGSGSVFSQIFDSVSGSERKTQKPAEVDSGNTVPVPPLLCSPPKIQVFYLETRPSSRPAGPRICVVRSYCFFMTFVQ